MGRRPGFTDEQVYSWLAERLLQSPIVTVNEVSKGTGVSVGSLYHRFQSMEELLASAWLWAFRSLSEVIMSKLEVGGLRGAVHAASAVVEFSKAHRPEAILLFFVPKHYLVRDTLKGDIEQSIADARRDLDQVLSDLADTNGYGFENVEMAILTVPTAIAAKYLPENTLPESALLYVKKICRLFLQSPT